MTPIPPDIQTELAKFLNSASGQWLVHHLREYPASMPAHFTPADGNLQQHHVTLHHAFGIGERAKITQILALAESRVAPTESEPLRLFDTKQLA